MTKGDTRTGRNRFDGVLDAEELARARALCEPLA